MPFSVNINPEFTLTKSVGFKKKDNGCASFDLCGCVTFIKAKLRCCEVKLGSHNTWEQLRARQTTFAATYLPKRVRVDTYFPSQLEEGLVGSNTSLLSWWHDNQGRSLPSSKVAHRYMCFCARNHGYLDFSATGNNMLLFDQGEYVSFPCN